MPEDPIDRLPTPSKNHASEVSQPNIGVQNILLIIKKLPQGVVEAWPFWAGVAMFFFVHGSFLGGNFLGLHDTKLHALNFTMFYRHFFWEGTIPQFLPFGGFGMPAIGMQCYITPFEYLCAAIGRLFSISNPLAVWAWSIILQNIVFIGGIYLCVREFTASKKIQLIAALACGATVLWEFSIDLSFISYSFLPLSLYFLVKYFIKLDLLYLFISFFVAIFGILGGSIYLLPFHLILFIFVFLLLATRGPTLKISGFRSNIFFLILLLFILLGVYMASSIVFGEEFVFMFGGRDPDTKQVPYETFLSYGGNIDQVDIQKFFSKDGMLWHGLGFINPVLIGLFAAALTRGRFLRHPAIGSFCLSVLFIFVVARGGFIASVAYYYFPGMKYFRHLGLLYSHALPFIALAGLIAYAIWDKGGGKGTTSLPLSRWFFSFFYKGIFALLFVIFAFDLLVPEFGRALFMGKGLEEWHWVCVVSILVAIVVCLAYSFPAKIAKNLRFPLFIFLFAHVLVSAQSLRDRVVVDYDNGLIGSEIASIISKPFTYNSTRLISPPESLLRPLRLGFLQSNKEAIYNTQLNNAIGIDFLYPQGKYFYLSKQVVGFLLKTNHAVTIGHHNQLPHEFSDEALARLGFTRDIFSLASGSSEKLYVTQSGLDRFKVKVPASNMPATVLVSMAACKGWQAIWNSSPLEIKPEEGFGFAITVPNGCKEFELYFSHSGYKWLSYTLGILCTLGAIFVLGLFGMNLFVNKREGWDC
jgi:hypothetical protein